MSKLAADRVTKERATDHLTTLHSLNAVMAHAMNPKNVAAKAALKNMLRDLSRKAEHGINHSVANDSDFAKLIQRVKSG